MQNKKLIIATVIFLTIAMSASLILIPSANAHPLPGWTFVSYPYIVASPNPVGVGQTVAVVMWIDDPLPGATVTNDIRRHDYTLTITDPTGQNTTNHWDVVSDSTSVQYMQFTPTQVGNYTLSFDYPTQVYSWSGTYQNDTFLGASKSITLVVQQEQIPAPVDSYPLPTEYWTRPIEGQNTYWFTIASNWLASPFVLGAGAGYGIPGAVQLDGSAPNSAHVMWTKPIQYGGVVGGNDTAILGEMYYSGLSYNTRFSNPIIMHGTLFYAEPWGNGATGGDYVAVDLRTGQEQWRINASATGVSLIPSFGYMYSYESPNQHGVLPNGLLIAAQGGGFGGGATTWRAYDARTGVLTTMNITNIPSGTSVAGPSGEILRYTLTNLGTTAAPKYYLTQWNSSRVFGGGSGLSPTGWYGGTVNASLPSAYDWNISLPSLTTSAWSIGTAGQGAIPLISVNDQILLVQGSFGGHPGDYLAVVTTDPANITDISLNSATLGTVSWTQTYQPAPGNNTRAIMDWDVSNGVFVFEDKESLTHYGYSLADGTYLWGPSQLTSDFTLDYNYMAQFLERIAYGKLYVSGYSGILFCYDDKTGDLLWTYGNGGEGNSTLSGFVTPYGRYPVFISTIADGKIYLSTTEHSPNSPLYKDAQFRAVNATDGTELWTIMNYGDQMYGGQAPVADGYLATLNSYDSQIYSFGRGPSSLTVEAPKASIELGKSLVISGTVTDIAAGTKQAEQAARFPNGVPAVSDASQSAWMEYVYMQKPKPTSTTGVSVVISVVDQNGNYRTIGDTTSDSSGAFSFLWTPDITGKFTVFANFAGSNSYYPSSAETSFAVDSAPPTPTPAQQISVPSNEMYFAVSTAAIIIAIAIVGAILAIMLKKH